MRLIGRDRTLALIRGHLADPSARVITIHGPAGCGTSAVLKSVAEAASGWLIDLADARREASIGVQVARRLGLSLDGDGDADAEARIAEVVAGRPVTLMIDHAEVRPLREGLARMLDRCPTLDVVVASAVPIGWPGERLVRLDPLAVPVPAAGLGVIAESPSVQLFVERALEVDADFRLSSADAEHVAQICRLVGGLPLGIELAATRVRVLPPAELAARLAEDGSDPSLLTSRVGDGARRWPSLRAALDSTTASLTASQRELFACVARFDGAFPVDAVEVIDGRALGDVLDDLGALVDARLIEPRAAGAAAEPSFDLLPIIRTYARETEWPNAAASATARRAYILSIAHAAAEAVADCRTSADVERMRILRRDVGSTLVHLVVVDPVAAATLAVDAATVLEALPERAVVAAVLDRFIATDAVAGFAPGLAARVWLWSSALLAESSDAQGRADAIGARWERARSEIDDGAQPLLGLLCRSIAVSIHPATGDVGRYIAAIEEGRALAAAVGHAAWLARFEVWTAVLVQASGRPDEAAALALTALRRATRVGDERAIASATVLLRAVPADLVDPSAAVPSLESALELARTAGDAFAESMLLAALTGRELDAGNLAAAARWCRLRLEDTTRRGWRPGAGLSVVHAALLAAASGDAAFAARLFGAMAADEERILRLLPPSRRAAYTALPQQLTASLGAERYSKLVAEGSMDSEVAGAAAALAWLQRDEQPADPLPDRSSPTITPRELEVLGLLANGLTNREIAEELLLSVKTVMHHSVAIYRKLDVRGRAEATAYAHRHGLVTAR